LVRSTQVSKFCVAALVVFSTRSLEAQQTALAITGATQGSSKITVTPNAVPAGDTAKLVVFNSASSKCDAAGEANPLPLQGDGSVSGTGAQTINLAAPLNSGQVICVAEKYSGTTAKADDFLATPINVSNSGSASQPDASAKGSAPAANATTPAPTSNVAAGAGTASNTFTIGLTVPAGIPTTMSNAIVASGKITYDESNTEPISSLVDQACQPLANDPTIAGRKKKFSTYEVFNVINLAGDDKNQSVASNNWYIFNEHPPAYAGFHGWKLGDFDPSTRFYGAKHIILVSIVVNYKGTALPSIQYGTILTQETPTNLSDAYQLLGIVFPPGQTGAGEAQTTPPDFISGCTVIPIGAKYSTSSIEVDTTFPATGTSSSKATLKFVNEPKSWWDVSFALPVKKASALTYSSSGTATTSGTITASTINKQNLFAVFDFYLPFADLKKPTATQIIPHPFLGAAITGRPLDNMLFGVSGGLHLVEVYVGALLIKQQQLNGLSAGGSATTTALSNATSNGFQASLSVGIKISIPNALTLLGKST